MRHRNSPKSLSGVARDWLWASAKRWAAERRLQISGDGPHRTQPLSFSAACPNGVGFGGIGPTAHDLVNKGRRWPHREVPFFFSRAMATTCCWNRHLWGRMRDTWWICDEASSKVMLCSQDGIARLL